MVPGQVNDVYGEHEVRPGLEATVLPSPDEAPVPHSLCLGAKERGLGSEQRPEEDGGVFLSTVREPGRELYMEGGAQNADVLVVPEAV